MRIIPHAIAAFASVAVAVCLCAQQDDRGLAATEIGASGGTGMIRGSVKNLENNSMVAGAQVEILEPALKVESGADGTFEFRDVPSGQRTVQVVAEGLSSSRITAEVRPGETIDVAFDLRLPQVTTIVSTGLLRDGSGRGVTIQIRQAATSGTAISGEQMKSTVAGSAATAASQMTGVSTVDSKFVYVRGLGDRYSQTLLNGANVPSPEPDKRAIPLDLFPTNLLESITISKTYSPDFPGEFSGGSVQIRTVGVPESPFVSLGSDFKYRYGTTLRDFKTNHGGNLDYFGIDDGTRAIPGAVPQESVSGGSGGSALTDDELQIIARSFNNFWAPETITAPVDHKVSLSFGHRIGKKGDQSLGIVGAINWANRYQNVANDARRIVVNTGTTSKPKPEVFSDFRIDSSTYEAELSGLLNLTYEINSAQKIGVRSLYTRTGQDEVREQDGTDGQRPYPIRLTRLRYVERSLLSVQPFGEHLLAGDTFLEWRAGYALSQRDEPDNRQVRYILDPNRNQFTFEPSQGSGRRDFYQLDENIYDAAFDYSIPFKPFGVSDKNPNPDRNAPEQKIKIGPALVLRKRDFDARRFVFEPAGGTTAVDTNGVPIDFYASPEEIFQNKNLNPNGFVVTEATRNTDNYEAEQMILAGYGLVDFRIFEPLRVQAGVRYEDSVQKVTTLELFATQGNAAEVETDLKTKDFLPAVNVIWELLAWKEKIEERENEQTVQLRLGGSQTVSRPEFRELAPFEYTDVQGGYAARGNPDLKRAKILNADIAIEWFLSPGEILSAGFFYKKFDSPIEAVNVPLGSQLLTTWENADSADLFGLEIEGRKNLGFVKGLKDFSLISNFSWMDSEVRVAENTGLGNLQTNKKRPLQGMPKFLFNAGLQYDSQKTGWTITILANTFGERISAVGASGIDDEKEQPRWSLDISVLKRLGNATLKLTAENILNDKYEFKQGDISTREYRRGFAIGFGYSYSF